MQAEGKGNIDRIRESNINTDETFMNVAEMVTIIASHTLLALSCTFLDYISF